MAAIGVEAVRKNLAYGALGFGGVAVLAPRAFAAIYGLRGDGNLRAMIRLWGTATAVVGAGVLTTKDPADRRLLITASAAMNVADALITLKAGSDVRLRSRLMGSATSAAFAAGCVYVLTAD